MCRRASLRHGVTIFETSVFARPHEYDDFPFPKISTLESVFENLRFRCPKTPDTCGRWPYSEKKSPFSKIPAYVWTGLCLLISTIHKARHTVTIVMLCCHRNCACVCKTNPDSPKTGLCLHAFLFIFQCEVLTC